jgi:hypothetical protein
MQEPTNKSVEDIPANHPFFVLAEKVIDHTLRL